MDELNINQTEQNVEQDLNEQARVRREKLAALQSAGKDPFQITKFDFDAYSGDILEKFDEL